MKKLLVLGAVVLALGATSLTVFAAGGKAITLTTNTLPGATVCAYAEECVNAKLCLNNGECLVDGVCVYNGECVNQGACNQTGTARNGCGGRGMGLGGMKGSCYNNQ